MSAELYFYFKKNPLQFIQVSGLNVMVNNEKTFNIKANMEVEYEITAGKCKIQMSMPYLGSETGIANIELDVKDGDRILLTYKSPITVFTNGAILVNKKNSDNYINWEDDMSNNRYRTLKVFEYKEWLAGCPIKVEKSQLLLDNQRKLIVLQVKMFNLSEKVIRAVYLDIECFDDAMNYVTKYNDIPYQGFNVLPQVSFGDRQANYFEESNIGNVKIIISKVVFEDNEVWRNNHLDKDYLLEEKKKHDELEPIHIHAEKEHKKSRAIIISIVIYYILLIIFYIKSISMLQENGYNLNGFGKKIVIIAFIAPIIIFTIYKIVISHIRQKRTVAKMKKEIIVKKKRKKVVIIFFGVSIIIIMMYVGNKLFKNNSLNELVEKGNVRRIERFLEEGNDVNEVDENGITALNVAINNGNEEIIKYLVENGADVNYIDLEEKSILQIAKEKNNSAITDFLIEKGAKETGKYIDIISGLAIEKIEINDKVYDGYKFCEFTTKNITKKNINYVKYEIILYKNGVKIDSREYVWDLVIEPGKSNTMTTCNTLPYTVEYDDVKIKIAKIN